MGGAVVESRFSVGRGCLAKMQLKSAVEVGKVVEA